MTLEMRYGNSESREPLHYNWCGLDDVYLVSGYDLVPTEDGDDISIHDLDGLHRAIGKTLARHKKSLVGKEVRFLRQQMDLTQSELGGLMGVTDQTVARWEKDETGVDGPADVVIRGLYLACVVKNIDLREFLVALRATDSSLRSNLVFEETDAGWKEAA